jgi:hypothetical protein
MSVLYNVLKCLLQYATKVYEQFRILLYRDDTERGSTYRVCIMSEVPEAISPFVQPLFRL